METYFRQVVYPVLTPLAFDPGPAVSAHFEPEPEPGGGGSRRQRRGAIRARQSSRHVAAAGSRVGPGCRRTRRCMIWLEQLIIENLQMLFPGLEIIEAYPFRVTRDAEVEIQELESDDLLETIEEAVWQRRFRAVVRLQVSSDIPEHILETLIANLELDRRDVYPVDGPLDLSRLRQILSIDRPGSERRSVSPAYSAGAESEIGGRHFRGAAPRRRAAASSLRFLPAGGRVPAARRGRSGRAGDQDDAVPRGAQFADGRKPARARSKTASRSPCWWS